jgi:DNA polymerase/3'-5' exonuclease PolX
MKYWLALDLINALIADIRDGCDRIEEAGSVRRRKDDCRDLEIVAIPRLERQEQIDLFGESRGFDEMNLLEERLRDLFDGGQWELDPDLKRNGPRYKRLRHVSEAIAADLFLTTVRGWGGALAIRTGPADFSQALVTLALRQGKHVADGYLIHGHPKPDRGCPAGAACPLIVPTPEETDFLNALGVPFLAPEHRTVEAIRRASMSVGGSQRRRIVD